MIGISLALVYFPKALQSVKLGIHSEDIYDLVSFVYSNPINRCPMKSYLYVYTLLICLDNLTFLLGVAYWICSAFFHEGSLF